MGIYLGSNGGNDLFCRAAEFHFIGDTWPQDLGDIMMAFLLRMIGKIGTWLGASTVASAGVEIAKWASWKILLAGFWFTGVYILCNNLFVFLLNTISAMMPAVYGGGAPGTSLMMELTGLGAYLANKMQLVESFSALISGMSLAFVRTFLPWPIGK